MNLKEYKKAKSEFMKNSQAVLAEEFKAFFDEFPEIKDAFGDGVKVVVTRKGFKISNYDHD